jgi:nitrogen fixation protein FixH
MTTIKKMKTAILSIAIGVASSTAAYAQDHDNNKSPHGGKVEEAGEYHIEASTKDGKAHFYLLDGKAKSMSNKGVTGSVVMQFVDGTTKTIKLMPMGDDAFMAEDAKATTYTNAIVTFKIADKTATAKFKNKGETKPHDHKEGESHHH